MRNLDVTNPGGMRPSKFTSFGAGVLISLALLCVPFAWGAAPEVPLAENPIVQFLLLLSMASLVLSVTSVVCKWDWRVGYFGIPMLCIGSISLLALVPLLVILIYGILSPIVKIAILFFYISSHVWWCRRFFVLYNEIFYDEDKRDVLYQEDVDVAYYMRRGDDYLLRKCYKFSQMPPGRYFLIFILLGLMLTPLTGTVRRMTGVPFAHVFLVVAMVPVSWMSIGLAFRGFLVCYLYPARIRKSAGKRVFVDFGGAYKKSKKNQ